MTIIKSNPEFKGKRDLLLKEHFKIEKSLEEVRTVVRYYDLLLNRMSEKTGFHIEREVAFLLILDALGLKEEAISEEKLQLFFEKVDLLFLEYSPVLIWGNIEDQLIKIKNAGKTASILSNTAFIHGDSLMKILQKLGLNSYFSFMIFSDVAKISKPNQKIFEMVYNLLQEIRPVNKKEILHIGDNQFADFEGAKKFGLSAKLVKF